MFTGLGVAHATDEFAWRYFQLNRWALPDAEQDVDPDPGQMSRCVQKLTLDVAFVSINIANAVTKVILRVTKHTYASLIGALGGNMGLFTGFSFLSLLDICVWARAKLRLAGNKRKKKLSVSMT